MLNNIDGRFLGINVAVDWIQDLASSDSRIHKEKVIEKALMAAELGSAAAQCFLFNCYLAYNPFYIYNIKQVPETTGLTDRSNPWPEFWALCEALRTRSISGNHMRKVVDTLSQKFDSDEWNLLCKPVLLKDLRCGVSEKTINKVVGKSIYAIPVFGCQLATDSEDHKNKLKGKVRVETKLDGVRVLVTITPNGGVSILSRNGKPFNNFTDIEATFFKHGAEILYHLNKTEGVVLDGEIIGESFQDLMKQAHRKRDVNASNSKLSLFDWAPSFEFQKGLFPMDQATRIHRLEELRSVFGPDSNVRIMPGIELDLDTQEGHDIMRRFAEDAVAEGYEGIMIKNLSAHYECKRSSNWMKWKPTITVDLTISDFEEGTGRNAGRLGAIVCEGVDNDRNIRVNVGSGFTDSNRDEYWNNRDRLFGCVVEVQADAVTQNQDGSYSLRFPRFVRFRGFEPGEKV